MRDDDIFKKIKVLEKISENKPAIEKDIHGLHEASSILWKSDDKTKEERQRRLANVFISAYIAAEKMGVKNIVKIIEDRLEELTKEWKS